MKDQDFELLSQYLDGELDIFTSRKLQQRITEEPELRATLKQLQAQNADVQAAFTGTDQAPAHVSSLLKPSSNVVALPPRSPRPAWQYAVAASLVAAAGLLLTPDWQQTPAGDAMLATVLEQAPSMSSGWESLEDGRQVRPVLSFKGGDGQWCREYLVSTSEQASRGVACRDNTGWNTVVIAATQIPGSANDFRPAGSADAEVIANYISENADGIALSASEEAEKIAGHWK